MRDLVTDRLHTLAGALADLHGRVRQAVAGEVGRLVAEAVGEAAACALGGRPRWPAPPAAVPRDEWDDSEDPWAAEGVRAGRPPADVSDAPPDFDLVGPAAVAAAAAAARWWRSRRGGRWGAAAAALAAAGAVLAGGPAVRPALAVLLAAHRLINADDALGAGADALGRA
jgi:hypothetical protein